MQFTKFFLFVCIICFQLSLSIIFSLLLPSPIHFWSFLSVFLSCFIYQIWRKLSLLHFVWSQPQSHCNPQYIIHLQLHLFCNPMQSSFIPAFHCNLWPFSLTQSPYTRCLWFCKPKSHNTASYICLTCSHTPVTGFSFIFLFSALHLQAFACISTLLTYSQSLWQNINSPALLQCLGWEGWMSEVSISDNPIKIIHMTNVCTSTQTNTLSRLMGSVGYIYVSLTCLFIHYLLNLMLIYSIAIR